MTTQDLYGADDELENALLAVSSTSDQEPADDDGEHTLRPPGPNWLAAIVVLSLILGGVIAWIVAEAARPTVYENASDAARALVAAGIAEGPVTDLTPSQAIPQMDPRIDWDSSGLMDDAITTDLVDILQFDSTNDAYAFFNQPAVRADDDGSVLDVLCGAFVVTGRQYPDTALRHWAESHLGHHCSDHGT